MEVTYIQWVNVGSEREGDRITLRLLPGASGWVCHGANYCDGELWKSSLGEAGEG